jgi:hypothetical protein
MQPATHALGVVLCNTEVLCLAMSKFFGAFLWYFVWPDVSIGLAVCELTVLSVQRVRHAPRGMAGERCVYGRPVCGVYLHRIATSCTPQA